YSRGRGDGRRQETRRKFCHLLPPALCHLLAILGRMLRDVEARVISNTRLSPDYNVIALAAPEIAEATQPGQFVMVKSARSADPLLRRPFSVFEVLRSNDRVEGLTLL